MCSLMPAAVLTWRRLLSPLMVSGGGAHCVAGSVLDQLAASSGAGSARNDRIRRVDWRTGYDRSAGNADQRRHGTALDSTSPGQTRAVVTRDIHGFDGTRVLILADTPQRHL
jgi:hypothetical protein